MDCVVRQKGTQEKRTIKEKLEEMHFEPEGISQCPREKEEGIFGRKSNPQRHRGDAKASLCDNEEIARHHELANGQNAEGLSGQPLFHGHIIKYRASPVAFWRVMKQWLEHTGVEQSEWAEKQADYEMSLV